MHDLLKKIPGSRRAADGVIIDFKNGSFFHITNIHSSEAMKGLSNEEAFFLTFCSRNEIIRMRSLRTAHDSLLHYRANAIVDEPRTVRIMNQRKSAFEKNGRLWSLSEYYHSMDGFRRSYIQNLSKNNQKILKSIPAGMAFVNEANAMCKRTFLGDFIVVSETLEKLFYYMTIGIFGGDLDIWMGDRVNALLIGLRIMNGAETLDFDIDSRGDLPIKTHRAVQSLVQSQMEFTFGHEYAHYLLNHLAAPDMSIQIQEKEETDLSDQVQIVNKNYSHENEYEADFYAIKFIENNSATQKKTIMGAYSVFLFFAFLQEIEVLQGLRKFTVSCTHPEPLERLWALWRSLGRKGVKSNQEIEQLIGLKDDMKQILDRHIKNSGRADILSLKGSVYLPSLKDKIRTDRIEF